MRFQTELVPARLVRRYKRFLAEATLESSGEVVTAHCPNPGAMTGLAVPGTRIWLEPNDDARRKLRYSWRLVEHLDGHLTCVDTSLANQVVREALEAREVPALAPYDEVRAEVPFGKSSRVDFVLSGAGQPDHYVEVKSVTLSRHPGLAEFPDTVTERGARHMVELAAEVQKGNRASVLFVVCRTDGAEVKIAQDIDARYGEMLRKAYGVGVGVLAHGANISPSEISLGRALPVTVPNL